MSAYTIPNPPKGMRFNPDGKIVTGIVEELANKTDGFCPCIPKYLRDTKNEDYKCICKNARENSECHCNLFVRI